MTTENRMSTLFNDFLTAAHAMEELPRVQAELKVSEGNLKDAERKADEAFGLIHQLDAQIADLKSQLAAAKGERDEACFRELEVRDKLETLVKSFQAINVATAAAVKAVEPEPIGQSDTDPTGHANVAGQSPNAPIQGATTSSPSDRPFASSTEGQSPPVSDTMSTPAAAGATAETLATASVFNLTPEEESWLKNGKEFWHKPPQVTWERWQSIGGLVPPYYS